MKKFRVRPSKDKDGMIDPDILEVYHTEDPLMVFPAGRSEFRVGQYLSEEEFVLNKEYRQGEETWVAYAKDSWYLPKK